MDYKKTVENNSKYLVCKCDDSKKSYTYKMLQNNDIESLIKPAERNINGELYLYYKTDSYRTMEEMFNDRECFIRDKDINDLCKSFVRLEHDLSDYLLNINNVVIKPDTLMYDSEKGMYVFIYIPEYSDNENEFHNSLLILWEYILSKYDHDSDMKRTMRVYETYQKIRSCNYTIGTLLYNITGVEIIDEKNGENTGSHADRAGAAETAAKNTVHGNKGTVSEKHTTQGASYYSDEDDKINIWEDSGCADEYRSVHHDFSKNSTDSSKGIPELKEKSGRRIESFEKMSKYGITNNYGRKTEKYLFIIFMAAAAICTVLILLPINMKRPNTFILFIIIAVSLFICFKFRHSVNNSKSKKIQIIYNDREYNPEQFPLTVGSRDEMDISIREKGVSRHHLTIYESESEYYIEDNGSTNGTFINNKKINPFQKRMILDGDVISLADVKLIICIS